MATLFGRFGTYTPKTPADKAKARKQASKRKADAAMAAEWMQRTALCINGCGREAARYEDSPGRTLRHGGACSPECKKQAELKLLNTKIRGGEAVPLD